MSIKMFLIARLVKFQKLDRLNALKKQPRRGKTFVVKVNKPLPKAPSGRLIISFYEDLEPLEQ
ncbi:MAG TPA: hypothetical protein DCM71_21250 [Runella sp.]|nr:hypothetical protein [Runella sp.]